MTNIILPIVVAIIILAVGGLLLWKELKKRANEERNSYLKTAREEIELLKKDRLLEVREEQLRKQSELEKEFSQKESRLQSREDKLKNRENNHKNNEESLKKRERELDQRGESLDKKEKHLELRAKEVESDLKREKARLEELREEERLKLEKIRLEELLQLERIGGMSAEEAKSQLVERMKEEARSTAATYVSGIVEEAKLTANHEAKKIVVKSIQRIATETAVENAVTVFHIDNDEMKGRIIGREGRNIRTLEAATGVEIIVDDTPEAIVLSCFDPVRREVARLTLHQLVQDGRIHPARIEEVVEKVKAQLEEEIIETGKRTTIDLGIHGMHPELIRLVGKMKYRSSYGQNLLQHARETANLCAVMASELGENPKLAMRAGLLHDIGKVPDDQPELPHAILGMKLCEKYNEKAEVCNAVGAHHEEVEMETLLAPIVQACDAISGARPGARREIAEAYVKRLNDLEKIALQHPGVVKTYAIQAGRELRVIVASDTLDDLQTQQLSADIAKQIQDEMTYPGQVKITVIREKRAVAFAK